MKPKWREGSCTNVRQSRDCEGAVCAEPRQPLTHGRGSERRFQHLRIAQYVIALIVVTVAAKSAVANAPPRVRVDAAHHGFVDADRRRFVPFGVTYYRPGSGWAPQVWKQFDPAATRQDFARLRKLGVNVVRVFISFGSFWNEPGQLDPQGLAKFDQFLDLADEAGLYVHPTGPDGWEGMPSWTSGMDMLQPDGQEKQLAALERFWRIFAGRYHGRSTIWAYDLHNEPTVAWGGEKMQASWDAWRKQRGLAPAAIPDENAKADDPLILDFQHCREHIAGQWVERQSAAIHAVDPDALVSVGLIQWSVPAQPMAPRQYSAFRPSAIATYLDFMELHYYPLVTGAYHYESAAAETMNLAVLESMAREAAKPRLPLVISEFGWAGGGSFAGVDCTEAQQASWCYRAIDVTVPMATGWLNWGMYDHPQAGDVSVLTGLLTVDGREKAWGTAFAKRAAQFREAPPHFDSRLRRPDLPWDQCIVSAEAMEHFRQAYLAAFNADHPKKR